MDGTRTKTMKLKLVQEKKQNYYACLFSASTFLSP